MHRLCSDATMSHIIDPDECTIYLFRNQVKQFTRSIMKSHLTHLLYSISIFTSFLRHLVPACTTQKSLEDTRCTSHVIFEASSGLTQVILLCASPQAATSSPVNGVWRQVQVATADSWLSQAITTRTRN